MRSQYLSKISENAVPADLRDRLCYAPNCLLGKFLHWQSSRPSRPLSYPRFVQPVEKKSTVPKRTPLDRYPPSNAALQSLLSQCLSRIPSLSRFRFLFDISGSSTDVIAQFFQPNTLADFSFETFSNDIDSRLAATSHLDARLPTFPQLFLSELTSVSGTVPIPSNTIIITSPPYDRDGLFLILKNSFQLSQLVAMKLPLNFLDPGIPDNIEFLQIGSGLSRVLIMSRDVAGGEHGPRRQRYTEAWFLWDRADISRAPPVVSFHHTELVDSEPAASLPLTVSFACTLLLGSNRFMLPQPLSSIFSSRS